MVSGEHERGWLVLNEDGVVSFHERRDRADLDAAATGGEVFAVVRPAPSNTHCPDCGFWHAVDNECSVCAAMDRGEHPMFKATTLRLSTSEAP